MKPYQRHWWRLLVILSISLLIWLPRGLGLNRYATADENAWLTRAANFYRAIAHGDWAGTFQRHHPGVTLTWAGTFGFLTTYPRYSSNAERSVGWLAEELTPLLREHGHEPIDLLAAGRSFAVLLIVLALTLSFVFAWRVWGLWPALVGSLLLAFDPFHIAHARLMHLDGLLSSFMLLAVVALFVALNRAEERRWQGGALITAGVAAGLAWLTRSPGLFLLPFAGLMGVTLWLRSFWGSTPLQGDGSAGRRATGSPNPRDLWAAAWFLLARLTIWAALAAATFYLLWPAMWVAPVDTLREVLSAANAYAEEGHADPIFFNGVIYNGDPGFWFYPITFLWRTTPLVLVGLGLALVSLALRKTRLPDSGEGRGGVAILLLLAFALCFVLFMNLGSKKFDRYALPIYPMLDLAAGMGFVAVAGWAWPRRPRPARQIVIALLAGDLLPWQAGHGRAGHDGHARS